MSAASPHKPLNRLHELSAAGVPECAAEAGIS